MINARFESPEASGRLIPEVRVRTPLAAEKAVLNMKVVGSRPSSGTMMSDSTVSLLVTSKKMKNPNDRSKCPRCRR